MVEETIKVTAYLLIIKYLLITSFMKIVTWNCNGALRKKMDWADSLNAYILAIQQCEDPSESISFYKKCAGDFLWAAAGQNQTDRLSDEPTHHSQSEYC
ncbi:MAG: hypothetical protein R3E95_14850 [Thiolinea sp.]